MELLEAELERLHDWMSTQVDGFQGPLVVKRLQGGQSNPTYRLDTPARRYVLRSKPAPVSALLPSAHAIEREFRIQRALAGSAVPVASVIALCEDEAVIGRAFYVMDFVDGRIYFDPSLPEVERAARGVMFAAMNRTIATLHKADYQALGLADYGKPTDYFARQIARWSKQYRASETTPIAAMDALIEWLPAHIPADERSSIVHGDFRLDNLVWHPTQPEIIAVLDWELSTIGHPVADFAYHLMTWVIEPGVFRGIRGLDLEVLGIPDQARYIKMYELATGKEIAGDWNFYLAYNLFRVAAILQGVAKRAADGTAADPRAHATAHAARPLAEAGLRYAQRSND